MMGSSQSRARARRRPRLFDVAAEHLLIEIRRLRANGDGIAARSQRLQGYASQLVQGEARSAARTGSFGEDDLVERVRRFRTQAAARTFVNISVQVDRSRYSLGYAAQSQHNVGRVTLRRERGFADLAGVLGPRDQPDVEH